MALLFALATPWLASGCSGESHLTVADLWEQAATLDGSQVVVRGWQDAIAISTAIGCSPMRCDCNGTRGVLRLGALENHRGQLLIVPDVTADGDDCHVGWSPFAPLARAYELVGHLRADHHGDRQTLYLESLDLAASSQLSGGADLASMGASPIDVGDFSCTCPLSAWIHDCRGTAADLSCEQQ